MGIALVASTKIAPSGSSGGTTPAVDTTGANLIVLIENDSFGAPAVTISDNLGNTYAIRANVVSGGSASVLRFYDCFNPTTGVAHTFSAISSTPSFAALSVLAFSGADTAGLNGPWVGNPGAGTSGTTSQPGTISITANNAVVVSATTVVGGGSPDSPGTFSVDLSFALAEQMPFHSGKHFGQATAFFVEGVAANLQPTFTYANTTTGWGAKSVAYAQGQANYSLTCAAGSFTETGKAATFLCGRAIRAETGVFTLRGFAIPAGSSAGHFRLAAAYGAFTLTGEAATLQKIKLMVLDTGYFVLTGEDADFLQVTPWEAAHICGDTPDPWTPQ